MTRKCECCQWRGMCATEFYNGGCSGDMFSPNESKGADDGRKES